MRDLHKYSDKEGIYVLPEYCNGCAACKPVCPVSCIDINEGKAKIIQKDCILCGWCIPACLKKAISTSSTSNFPLSRLSTYNYRIALPAPSLYARLPGFQVSEVNQALYALGFNEIASVHSAMAMVNKAIDELISAIEKIPGHCVSIHELQPRPFWWDYMANYHKISSDTDKFALLRLPLIASFCPAVVRLIQLEYPTLTTHLLPLLPPMEIATRLIKSTHINKRTRPGVFFITSCAGKLLSLSNPCGYPKTAIDGTLSIGKLIPTLLALIEDQRKNPQHIPIIEKSNLNKSTIEHVEVHTPVDNARRKYITGIQALRDEFSKLINSSDRKIDFIGALYCKGGCNYGPL